MRTAVLAVLMAGAIGIAQAETVKKPDPMPGASKDECVSVRMISGWRVLDSRHVVIYSPNRSHAYLMELGTPISDLDSSFKVAFIDRDRDGQLCGRSLDKVQAVDPTIRQPAATIMGMTRLNESGLRALEEQYHVSLIRKKDAEKS
jgi:hypothetical protein